jgi:hypothetical protein
MDMRVDQPRMERVGRDPELPQPLGKPIGGDNIAQLGIPINERRPQEIQRLLLRVVEILHCQIVPEEGAGRADPDDATRRRLLQQVWNETVVTASSKGRKRSIPAKRWVRRKGPK